MATVSGRVHKEGYGILTAEGLGHRWFIERATIDSEGRMSMEVEVYTDTKERIKYRHYFAGLLSDHQATVLIGEGYKYHKVCPFMEGSECLARRADA